MTNYEKMRRAVATGLKQYCKVPVIRSNQNESPPDGDYLSYTVTTLKGENLGTYSVYDDGMERKPFIQIWSISSISSDNSRSVQNACSAHEWLDHAGTLYLNDNDVIVQSVGAISNRDNFLTVGYEYKNGFDVTFLIFDEITNNSDQIIDEANFTVSEEK